MTPADFASFVLPWADRFNHARLVRPVAERNRYAVVLAFGDPALADAFRRAYHGRAYLSGPRPGGRQSLFPAAADLPACAVCLERLVGAPEEE
eukprot:contig_31898_g7778